MTVIYLIRHSKALQVFECEGESLQLRNEKTCLSIEGEKMAEKFSRQEMFSSLERVISSNYVRAISTAKYLVTGSGQNVVVMKEFGERKHGVNSWDELPDSFEKRQLDEVDFKVGNGESRADVTKRMREGLAKVLHAAMGKTVAIVSHATAITFLLMSFGEKVGEELIIKDRLIFDKDFVWNNLDTIKLIFDRDKTLVDVQLIRNEISMV